MFTVIKLGGVNGSGKTTVAKELIKLTGAQGLHREGFRKNPTYYFGRIKQTPALILGSYETACGGMDTISDKDDRLDLLKWACSQFKDGLVFYEGLITGKTYGAMGALSEEHVAKRKGRWLYAFMDTPFDVCVDRVLQRRAAAGNLAPFDAERTMRSTYKSCEALARKLQDGTLPAHPVHMVNHKHKPAKAAEMLMAKALEMHYGKK